MIQFDRYWYPYFKKDSRERFDTKLSIIKTNLVKRLQFLYEKSREKIGSERTIKILQTPDSLGNSLAFVICRDFSDGLFDWMVNLDIKPNIISTEYQMTPFFRDKQVIEYLLKKGLSPLIHYEERIERQDGKRITIWRCQMDDFKHNFEENGDYALSKQSQMILQDLKKEKNLCQCTHPRCSRPTVQYVTAFSPYNFESYFNAFFTQNKNMVPFNCADAVMYGNVFELLYHKTSMILKTTWNGQDAVMKCKYIPTLTEKLNLLRPEFEAVRDSKESDCIVAPLAYFRQQYGNLNTIYGNLERPQILNIDVLVLPRFHGDLRQLKKLRVGNFNSNDLRHGFCNFNVKVVFYTQAIF